MRGLQATHELGWLNVVVQKVTAPKPKEISARDHGKKEEMVSPKGLKPKNIKKKKRQAQKFMRKEERKGKEAQIRRLKKKAELGSSEIAKRLGIPEVCNIVKKGLRQLKRKSQKKEHKKQRMGTSFSSIK